MSPSELVKLSVRPYPNADSDFSDFVHGYPGIPPGLGRPGASVKGVLQVYPTTYPLKAKWVRIELKKSEVLPGGGEAATFSHSVGPGFVTLWNAGDGYQPLGLQELPFSIPIPEAAPPSVNLPERASISYQLVGSLCYEGDKGFLWKGDTIVSTCADIIIDKHELHSAWPIYCQPETLQITKEGITMIARRYNKCYGPGSSISIFITVNSVDARTLRVLDMKLKETIISRPDPFIKKKGIKPSTSVEIIGETKHYLTTDQQKISSRQSCTRQLSFNVPSDHTTPSLNLARNIDVIHKLTVVAYLDRGDSFVMELPVIISNWPRDISIEAISRIGPVTSLSEPIVSLDSSPTQSGQGLTRRAGVAPRLPPATLNSFPTEVASKDRFSEIAGSGSVSQNNQKVLFTNLPEDITEYRLCSLLQIFQGFLKIQDLWVPKRIVGTNGSGKMAIVLFESRSHAINAKEGLNEYPFREGWEIIISNHIPEPPSYKKQLQEPKALMLPGIVVPTPLSGALAERTVDDTSPAFLTSGSSSSLGMTDFQNTPENGPTSGVSGFNPISVICERLKVIFADRAQYKIFFESRDTKALRLLDFLQSLLDHLSLDVDFRTDIVKALVRLSKKSGLHPTCFTLENVELIGDVPITSGHFGDIWKGRYQNQHVCVKIVRLFQTSDVKKLLKTFSMEALIWGQLSHRNLLPFYGVYHLGDRHNKLCLVSPWMENGNINQFLKHNPNVNRRLLVKDVLHGIIYLHNNELVHGDLKGVNILASPSGRACLADFGLSAIAETDVSLWTSLTTATTKGGTVRWQAPELIDCGDEPSKHTRASDMYAFACVCYEIFTDNCPFAEFPLDVTVMLKVMNGKRPTRPQPSHPAFSDLSLSDQLWDMIEICWAHDPALRPTADKAMILLIAAGVGEDDRPSVIGDWDDLTTSRFRDTMHGYPSVEELESILHTRSILPRELQVSPSSE